jgi:hypothetical protein
MMVGNMRVAACFVALSYISSCVAFSSAGTFLSLRSQNKHSMRPSRSGVLHGLEMTNSREEQPVHQRVFNSVMGGVVAGSLILTPALDVFHGHIGVDKDSTAFAQGATSRKSTRAAPSTDANKDPESILRLTLPINEKNPIREAQVATVE